MVIGIDTHRDRVSQKTVVAIAAAWNKGFSMYYNTMTFAEDDEDVLNCIAPLIKGNSFACQFGFEYPSKACLCRMHGRFQGTKRPLPHRRVYLS